jgi:hypothetical protein
MAGALVAGVSVGERVRATDRFAAPPQSITGKATDQRERFAPDPREGVHHARQHASRVA